MDKKNFVKTDKQHDLLLIIGLGLFMAACILLLVFPQNETLPNVLIIIIGCLVTLIIFMYPPIGIGLVVVSTALETLLPDIPYVTSLIPLLGIATLAAVLVNKAYSSYGKEKLTQVEILALIFLGWAILSNPAASFLGQGRSWALTFIQLWVLVWLASHFINTPTDHHLIMFVISLGILASGVVAVIESSGIFNVYQRAVGLSGGANTTARYFIYGIILLVYLQNQFAQKKFIRYSLILGIGILIAGVFYSGSRSGIILFLIIAMLYVYQSFQLKTQPIVIIVIIGLGLYGYFSFSEGTIFELDAIYESIVEGSDTVGIRYELIKSGWQMFLDHPITGVGIGQFQAFWPLYAPRSLQGRPLTPHNTYIQILAETGFVGLLVFIVMIFTAFQNVWKHERQNRLKSKDTDSFTIDRTYLFILIILLIGAFTKTDLVDKFIWFLLGVTGKHSDQPIIDEDAQNNN